MPSILLQKEKHLNFVTTVRAREHTLFRKMQAGGDFYGALFANIEAYKSQGYWSPAIKKGLIDLLDLHVKMGTITDAQRNGIILIQGLA